VERPAAQPSPAFSVPASLFVGRRREVAELGELLKRGRLATLTGAAGCGKTRLALEIARRSVASRPDGPCMVELASLNEAESLPDAFATALDIRAAQSQPVADLLLERLASFDGLIVVDNCEHLVEACAALIDRLLRRCPKLTILATSREPLRVDGEHVWPVPPLSLPPEGSTMLEIGRAEAVILFGQKARQADPRFEISASNAREVAVICRRLDGLPLAIELAAARVAALDLATIREQLDDRFRFLTGGFRAAPHRQRTLRAAIDWSYDLLTTAEQQMFDRLSVFAGGFDASAVEAVCSGGAVLSTQVLDILGRLIDKSLVMPVDGLGKPRRYRLLDTLRTYGLDRLREEASLEETRRRLADHLVTIGDVSFGAWDRHEWLVRMEPEVDNFRDALGWSRTADPNLNLRLATAYGWLCVRSGFVGEGRGWLAPALERRNDDQDALAHGNLAMAFLAWRQHDFEAADRQASAAVSIRREQGDDEALGWALGALGFIRIGTLTSRSAIEEQLAIAKRLALPLMEAEALLNLGAVEAREMDLANALEHLSQSLGLYEASGADRVPPSVNNTLGWVLLTLHRPAEARTVVERGLLARLRTHDVIDMTASLDACAEIAFELGAPERAMRLIGASDAIRRRAGSVPNKLAVASRIRWLSRAEQMLGKAAHAAWLEGDRMTPQQAGAYALGSSDGQSPRAGGGRTSALTGRESQVAGLVASGMTNDEIAARLRLSTRTVEAHLDHIRTKLGVRTRVDVATWVTARSSPQPASP